MNSTPDLVLSRLDVERLERLLETPALAGLPAAAALQAEMARGRVVEPVAVPSDVVTMNSTVCCTDARSGREYRLTLVYPREADAAAGKISVLAPVGTALLGLRTGQHIGWEVPGGVLDLAVTAIPYQPERAGDWHR